MTRLTIFIWSSFIAISIPTLSIAQLTIKVGSENGQEFYRYDIERNSAKKIVDPTNSSIEKWDEELRLLEQADGKPIARNYWHFFFECNGSDVSPHVNSPMPIELEADAISIAAKLTLKKLANDIYVLAEPDGKSAVLITRSGQSILTPPCAAMSRFFRVSENKKIIVFVANRTQAISFIQGDRKRWGATYEPGTDLYIFNIGEKIVKPIKISFSETVSDVAVMNDGRIGLLLFSSSSNWLNPLNWLFAIGGHTDGKVNYQLLMIDRSGARGQSYPLIRGLAGGVASFY